MLLYKCLKNIRKKCKITNGQNFYRNVFLVMKLIKNQTFLKNDKSTFFKSQLF